MLEFFIISILSSIGIAILFVEKGEEWPLCEVVTPIKGWLNFIHPKLSDMFDCSVCTAFWAALFIDIFLFLVTGGVYFLWPLSGFAASGITWAIYEGLNALDKHEE